MNKLHTLTVLVHSLFCRFEHLTKMEALRDRQDEPGICTFYLEQVFDEAWQCRDHQRWLETTRELLQQLNTESPDEALRLLNQALGVAKAASPLIERTPQLRQVIISLIQAV